MPCPSSLRVVLTSYDSGLMHVAVFGAAPPARAKRPVADDAEHVRSERRIDAVHANRPDDDAVPEHDPDGTPWAA